jgi:hypothetical protein
VRYISWLGLPLDTMPAAGELELRLGPRKIRTVVFR